MYFLNNIHFTRRVVINVCRIEFKPLVDDRHKYADVRIFLCKHIGRYPGYRSRRMGTNLVKEVTIIFNSRLG